MNSKLKGVIQLLLSIAVMILVNMFFFKVFSLLGITFKGNTLTIMETVRTLLIVLIVFVIYYSNIRAGKNKFKRGFLNNFIYSLACFIFLIIITIGLHNLINYLGKGSNISIGYSFTNYFNVKFTLQSVLKIIEECIFVPFLLCVIFPLGFSNIFKRTVTTSILSGLVFGILYAISLNTTILVAVLSALTPAIVIGVLTYLYKTNQNIWSVIITYVCYVLFGIFAIQYLL